MEYLFSGVLYAGGVFKIMFSVLFLVTFLVIIFFSFSSSLYAVELY